MLPFRRAAAMPGTFHFRAGPGQRQAPPPSLAQAPATDAAGQPLASVLARLVGKPVALLVGGAPVRGRLLFAAPPTIVDAEGTVTVVDSRHLQGVQY